jgi:F0F1-type ATP synthase delta subunit
MAITTVVQVKTITGKIEQANQTNFKKLTPEKIVSKLFTTEEQSFIFKLTKIDTVQNLTASQFESISTSLLEKLRTADDIVITTPISLNKEFIDELYNSISKNVKNLFFLNPNTDSSLLIGAKIEYKGKIFEPKI